MADPTTWQAVATAALLLPGAALVVLAWLTIATTRRARAALGRAAWAWRSTAGSCRVQPGADCDVCGE